MQANVSLKCPKKQSFPLINSLVTFSHHMRVYLLSVRVLPCSILFKETFTNASYKQLTPAMQQCLPTKTHLSAFIRQKLASLTHQLYTLNFTASSQPIKLILHQGTHAPSYFGVVLMTVGRSFSAVNAVKLIKMQKIHSTI